MASGVRILQLNLIFNLWINPPEFCKFKPFNRIIKIQSYYLLYIFQTLYTYPENFRAFKALIAAQYAGANVKIAPGFIFGETNKSENFLKKFPLGKVSYTLL